MKAFMYGRIKAIKYVFRGIFWMLGNEASIQVQFSLMLLTGLLSYYLKFTGVDWVFFVLVWGLIFMAETFNTSIEKLADVVSPEFDERIGRVKDLSAGAVGWIAIAGAIVYFLLILEHV